MKFNHNNQSNQKRLICYGTVHAEYSMQYENGGVINDQAPSREKAFGLHRVSHKLFRNKTKPIN